MSVKRSPDPALQVQVRDALVAALKADLVGPMAPEEVLENRPSRWYVAGFLVPYHSPSDERYDLEAAEELSIDAPGKTTEPSEGTPSHSQFLPSSMGLSFLVGPGVQSVDVTVQWAEYTQLDEKETERYRALEWARRVSRELDRAAAAGEEPRGWVNRERRTQGASEDGEEESKFYVRFWKRTATPQHTRTLHLENPQPELLPGSAGVFLETVVRPAPPSKGPAGTRVVSVFLVNRREPQNDGADERFLFQTRVEVHAAQGFMPRHHDDPGAHPDDRRTDLQFRNETEWAVGHGVSVEVKHARKVHGHVICTRVATTWTPEAKVYRTKARAVEGVETHMERLAQLPDGAAVHAKMAALMDEYLDWIEGQSTVAESIPTDLPAEMWPEGYPDIIDRRLETGGELVDEAHRARKRIQAGLDRLAKDPIAFRAFQLTNTVMAQTAKRQRPNLEPHWRLFQLAFLLLNINGTADAEHPDRERVELLFFPTGGGKTEAYLGVAAFTLFMRRLTGQAHAHKGAGVGVLLRYTLRLLTLDQLQRAAQLICAMELQRRENPGALGPHRFSIGVWVGRKATANRFKDLKPIVGKLKRGRSLMRGEPSPVPLKACPWCQTPFGRETYVLLPVGAKHPDTLQVTCSNDDCEFNANYDPDLPERRSGLPIVTVDEQVYRELPSILIGTVDKFASLPWRGASGNLFGRVRAENDVGFIGNDVEPPRSATPLPDGLLPPDLIIQDELHLITGPLGTMVGLYETAVDALCRDKVPRGAKLIASTATAQRATEQIQAIFARDQVHLFPPQGLDDGDTFFSMWDRSPEKTRVYLGVTAPGRSMKLLTSRTYTGLLGAAQRQWEAAGAPGHGNEADTFMSLVAYFNALRDLGGAQRIFQEEVAGRTPRLLERRPLDDDHSTHFANRYLNFEVLELTSRQEVDDITRTTEVLRKPFDPQKKGQRTDVLLASSMISVGVDISRLGLMVVNGQPRTVAEYIQASSRVGRSSPGLVVTAYSLYKPRDRSYYERFTAFHNSFYRFVEAASVTPFSARALDRGLAGVVVGLARHLPTSPRLAAPHSVMKLHTVDDLEERLAHLMVERATQHTENVTATMKQRLRERVTDILRHWDALVKGADRSGGGALSYSYWEGRDRPSLLRSAVDPPAKGPQEEHLQHFQVPTSMRDVEPTVHIWVDQRPTVPEAKP